MNQLLIDQLITYSDYEYLTEQKSAESKEDTQLLAGDYAISHYEQGKTYSSMEVHKMLADAFIAGKSYQKQEWGEDDEFPKILDLVYKAIRKVLANFRVYSEDEELLDSREESIDYYSQRCAEEILKSLRPSWKPSEEQMKAMSYFVRKHQATANRATTKWPEFEAFKSLYNDLKKRM